MYISYTDEILQADADSYIVNRFIHGLYEKHAMPTFTQHLPCQHLPSLAAAQQEISSLLCLQ